jgi:hypothetical protein
MVPTRFSTDDETWPLMAVLTWIATRSLKFVETHVGRDVFDAHAMLALARQCSGTPGNVGYPEAFQALCEKIDAQRIRGRATKLKWIVLPEHELLSSEKCFSLAESVQRFESNEFRPQDLRNANTAGSPALQLNNFVFHNVGCLTPKGSGYGSPNPDGAGRGRA